MANPLFNMFGSNQKSGIMQRFEKFRQSFSGDPQKQVQELLNSGRISQAQYDQAVKKARELQKILGI